MTQFVMKNDTLFKEILNVLLSDSSKKIFIIKYFGNDFVLNARRLINYETNYYN